VPGLTFCFTLGVRQRGANPGIGLAFGALAHLLWPLGPGLLSLAFLSRLVSLAFGSRLSYYGLWAPTFLVWPFYPGLLVWPLGPGLFAIAFGGPGLLAMVFGPWLACYCL
jgi:hypothetical protein